MRRCIEFCLRRTAQWRKPGPPRTRSAPGPRYAPPSPAGTGQWCCAFLDGGLSQTTIAVRAGLSQSQVSRLANGKSREPGMNTVKALCDGLAIPRSLAGLQDGSGEEDDTDRRQFLGGTLGVLAAAALGGGGLEDERLLMASSLSYRQLEQRTPA